ncbi:MAG: hypothetical protein AAGP08_03895 [Pseudomonadota bacterium]
MTDTSGSGTSMPLGAGTIISESFSILFGNFVKVIVLGFLGTYLGFLINGLLLGFDQALGLSEPDPFNINWFATILSVIIPMVVYGLVTALLVQLAYDAKLQRPRNMGAYLGPAFSAAVPIAVLSIVVGILVAIGAIALLIGALWVYAVFCVMSPAVVIERAGFGALGRSAGLTKGYRWPIVGVLIVVWVLIFLLQFAAGFVLGLLATGLTGSTGGLLFYGILFSLIGAFGYGMGGISVALIYARLREIKEGIGVDEIAKVFE